jgi:hypothetical protein
MVAVTVTNPSLESPPEGRGFGQHAGRGGDVTLNIGGNYRAKSDGRSRPKWPLSSLRSGGLNRAMWAEKCVQVFEVTPDKKVVWKVKQWSNPNLGPGSSTQLLDEPGVPENPGELAY